MDISGTAKPGNASLSFRYNANNEELEELYQVCEDDPPTPQFDASPSTQSENASPKKIDKSSSIIDKYFKRIDKLQEKVDDIKSEPSKVIEDSYSSSVPKDVTFSPMKDYLNRLGKKGVSTEVNTDIKEAPNETWKIFHGFKYKIAQAVGDMKSRSIEETKDKCVPRDNSMSDSEENSVIKDSDQQSVGDTDNQVSSLDSSIQNLSELSQAITAKVNNCDSSLTVEGNNSELSDDPHRNIVYPDFPLPGRNNMDDSLLDIESGVEALEESNIDLFADESKLNTTAPPDSKDPSRSQSLPSGFAFAPSKDKETPPEKPKRYFFTFFMSFLTIVFVVSYILFPRSHLWNGFVLGLLVYYIISVFKQWVLDTYFCEWDSDKTLPYFQVKRSTHAPSAYTIPSVKEHRPLKKYEGWINHYRMPDYDPYTYHINKTSTAFMKLEGCNLRISYTKTKVAKRALWDENLDKIIFYQHRLYNLSGARVILLPKGLVRRRQWSKKYPICVILNESEKIQVLEKENTLGEKKQTETQTDRRSINDDFETNTSPEKKRKFIWKRKEKNLPHPEIETGKEGLRHRIVRKMHRDKKVDSVSTSTDPNEGQADKNVQQEESLLHENVLEFAPKSTGNLKDEAEDDFDETEISRIKNFLEEAEREGAAEDTVEGEWSVHVKESRDKHSHLYIFARTGRDKHEWFRRLNTAISDAYVTATECSTSEDKNAQETDRDIDLAVYKVTEKDSVTFSTKQTTNKSTNNSVNKLHDQACKSNDAGSETTVTSNPTPYKIDNLDSCEKTFWPYLFKIIQTHEVLVKRTMNVGVMCQIDPPVVDKVKNKKKSKHEVRGQTSDCECRALPGEVAWINTVLARVVFDVMRDPNLLERIQNRIQRKLHTLKLPSLMSPLVVTELRLGAACPLLERVAGPAWDARGVWLDADLRYDGGAYITILTQINLMKLKEKDFTVDPTTYFRHCNSRMASIEARASKVISEPTMNWHGQKYQADNALDDDEEYEEMLDLDSATPSIISEKQLRRRKPAIFDSDMEDSAESSSDDESPPIQPIDSAENMLYAENSTTEGGSSKKKFLRMVDKIATNKYFQQEASEICQDRSKWKDVVTAYPYTGKQVTDYKYVKRAMEGLSNTDIKLKVEVLGLEGRLAVNIPPPPHDRIWIGFRTNPQLVLKARPAVGARTVRFAHISNWIEQKLTKEFEKVLVLPNMEDIVVEVMTPTPVRFE